MNVSRPSWNAPPPRVCLYRRFLLRADAPSVSQSHLFLHLFQNSCWSRRTDAVGRRSRQPMMARESAGVLM